MNIKVDFDNIVVKEDKNDFNVKVLMLKGEKGDAGDGENNVIEKVQVNGTDLPVNNKTVNVPVPIVDSELSPSSTNPVQNNTIYNAFSNKADASELNNYYEISEVDDLLNTKADITTLDNYYQKNETYNQNEINSLLNNKANTSDINTINSTLLTKANTSDVANTYETKANHNASISTLTSQISSLASGSPLVASSTSGMTDTTKTYVNTADGYWYYYNGNEWARGGVYQGTELSNGVVNYNKLDALLKKESFVEIHAEDLLWKLGKGMYNGQYFSDENIVSSSPFILPKGNTITINTTLLKYRITYYDLNYNYIGNTGSYSSSSTPWSYNDTCIVIISVTRGSGNVTEESDCNNTNIIFNGVVEKESYNLGQSILSGGFSKMGSTRMFVSKPFYLEKGTKISLSPDLITISGSYPNYGLMFFNIQEENIQKDISNSAIALHKGYFTATQSGMVRLSIAFLSTTDMSSSYYEKLPTILKIEKIPYIEDNNKILYYSSANANIDYFYNNGSLYIRFYNDFCLSKNGSDILTINITNLETAFPDNIETINNIKYFKLIANQILIYDIYANELKLTNFTYSSFLLGSNTVIIAANKYNCFACGILLDYINKLNYDYMFIKNDMFNSQPYRNFDWQTPVKNFNKMYKNKSTNIDTFLYFTDPHIVNGTLSEENLINYFNPLEKVYNSIPVEYIVCGGDWLTDSDTQDIACFKLGYIDGFMNAKFKNYYPLLGNHDTNYQGKLDTGSSNGTGTLTNDTLTNLFFSKYKKNYYSFKGNNNYNYILDTGLDSVNTMNSYRWEQVDWLADKLIEDNPSHAIVFMHIVWAYNTNWVLGCMTDPITRLIDAFNNHTSITLNSISYDFSSTTGHIDYVLSGHTHEDHDDTINNVLCIATTMFRDGVTGAYDIIFNDYDNNKAYFTRIGSGEDREFDI